MTFEVMRQVAVEMARSFRIAPSRFTGGNRLSPEAAQRLRAVLAEAGVTMAATDEALEALGALRATYEPLLDGLAQYLLLALPEWLPNEDAADHWTRGHRGLIAERLLDQLTRMPDGALTGSEAEPSSPWRRLRARLRQ